MDDAGSKPASKPSGIVAELAGLLAGAKVGGQGYEDYLTKKYS
jgi:uncharacterized membrane protein YebE (DUF533 family)